MITPMHTTDIEEVIRLLYILRSESPTFDYIFADEVWVTNSLLNIIQSEKGIANGYYNDDGALVGFIMGGVERPWYSPEPEAYEMLLAVFPEYRGSSVAYRLIKSFMRTSKELGAVKVSVGTSLGIADDRALRLYERLGFTQTGVGLTKRI